MSDPTATQRFTDVRRFDTIDSTNRYLLDEARAGAPEGVVAVADHQAAGRGRLGRRWEAPPGSSLLVSVLVRPRLPARQAHLVTVACALAAADAVGDVAGFVPDLKWPNDLLTGGLKLAGILAEADIGVGAEPLTVVVGVGINVQWSAIPPELEGIATACNLIAGRPVDRDALLERFLARLDDRYDAALHHAGELVAEYRTRCATLGADVRVEQAAGAFTGTAVDIDRDGRLVVETGNGREVVAAGDVVHVR